MATVDLSIGPLDHRVFGPTDPEVWGPRGERVQVLRGARMEDLAVDDVQHAIQSMS